MRHGRVPVTDFDDVAHLPGGGGPEDADVGDVADGVVVEEVFEQGAVVVEVDGGGAGAGGCDEGFEGEDVGGGAVGWETEGFDRAGRGHRARHDVLLDFVLRYVVGRSGLVGESQERSALVGQRGGLIYWAKIWTTPTLGVSVRIILASSLLLW